MEHLPTRTSDPKNRISLSDIVGWTALLGLRGIALFRPSLSVASSGPFSLCIASYLGREVLAIGIGIFVGYCILARAGAKDILAGAIWCALLSWFPFRGHPEGQIGLCVAQVFAALIRSQARLKAALLIVSGVLVGRYLLDVLLATWNPGGCFITGGTLE